VLGSFQFQPSELAKIAYILALAKYLRYRENYRTLAGLIPPALITLAPMGLILVEPDLGSSLVFVPVLAAMLVAAGARIKHLLVIALIMVAALPAMYPLLKPYQKDRITAIVAQWRGDPRHRDKEGYQAFKAMTLTGSGQVAGYGRGRAETVLKYNALPEAHNDMIFAVITARWGLLGGLATLGLYAVIVLSGLAAAALNKDPFARIICVGAVAAIFTQVVINIGMVIGLLPITGISLPFVSYGGTSLIATFMMIGLILNAAARRPIIMARPSYEFAS
jgi:cell division protein FtsW (lipid II flippase)